MVDTIGAPATVSHVDDGRRATDIPTLTGLRWFAAAIVVAYHLQDQVAAIAPYPVASAAKPLLAGGLLGVDVFFVLSGFVIAHNYAHRLANPAAGSRRDYFIARLARVYPLHLVTLVAMAVLLGVGASAALDPHAGKGATPLVFVGNLLMLQALPGIPAWNFPAWSISCELVAYLVFPLFAARLLRVRWAAALAMAIAVLCLQLFVQYEMSFVDVGFQGLYWPRIAGEFTAGALLWVVWSRALRPGRWGDAAAVLCALGTAWILWHGYPWPFAIPLLAAMIPAIASATGPVAGLLAHPVTQWGGRISYALYLVHLAVFTMFFAWVVPAKVYDHHSTWASVAVFGGLAVVTVAAAAFLHHGVEEPARRWLRRRFAKAPSKDAVPVGEVAPAAT